MQALGMTAKELVNGGSSQVKSSPQSVGMGPEGEGSRAEGRGRVKKNDCALRGVAT